MISKHFVKVKHQFVWPAMLPKGLLVSGKDNFDLIHIFGLRYFLWFIGMAYKETTFMLNLSSQGATLNVIAWLEKVIFFVL